MLFHAATKRYLLISYKLSDAAHAVNILCYYAIQIFCIQHNDSRVCSLKYLVRLATDRSYTLQAEPHLKTIINITKRNWKYARNTFFLQFFYTDELKVKKFK